MDNINLDKNVDKDYQRVTNLMTNLKFKPILLGFDFLRSAVLLCLKNKNSVEGITTEVYPIIAKEYHTKVTAVERNIRISIENAFNNGGLLSLNDYYNAIVYTNNIKFTNSEIIAILVEILRLDDLKRKVCSDLKENAS